MHWGRVVERWTPLVHPQLWSPTASHRMRLCKYGAKKNCNRRVHWLAWNLIYSNVSAHRRDWFVLILYNIFSIRNKSFCRFFFFFSSTHASSRLAPTFQPSCVCVCGWGTSWEWVEQFLPIDQASWLTVTNLRSLLAYPIVCRFWAKIIFRELPCLSCIASIRTMFTPLICLLWLSDKKLTE